MHLSSSQCDNILSPVIESVLNNLKKDSSDFWSDLAVEEINITEKKVEIRGEPYVIVTFQGKLMEITTGLLSLQTLIVKNNTAE